MLRGMMWVCFKWETNNYENYIISVPLRKHKLALNIREGKKHNYTKERWTESLIPGKLNSSVMCSIKYSQGNKGL